MSEVELGLLLRQPGLPAWRANLARRLESHAVQHLITAVIFINAIILGLETHAGIMAKYERILHTIDKICLGLFVVELGLKIIAFRSYFWRSGWNLFDVCVVSISLFPDSTALSVLRALKVLRVLRLLTVVTPLRKVTAAFLNAIPGIFSVVGVMCVFYYTMGVVATIIFGKSFPQWFGHLGRSLYSLFQIMTLEGWSESIVRKVMEVYPYAWAFFIPFIIIATFTIMNLFVGVIVAAMSELAITPSPTPGEARILRVLDQVQRELQDLRRREQERAAFMPPPAMIPPTDPGPGYPQPQGPDPLHEPSRR